MAAVHRGFMLIALGVALAAHSNQHLANAGAPPGPSTAFNDAGYVDVPHGSHYFYWVFESQSKPSSDPLVVWLSGGPGCSSQVAMFGENGPYQVQDDLSLKANPYSWNRNATVVWVDQPVDTGFSYGGRPLFGENEVAEYMFVFLQGFLDKYPHYRSLPLYIFGESYAGHYVPAVSAKIVQEIRSNASVNINFAGSAVGNGLVDPEIQFDYYIPFVEMYNGSTALQISKAELDLMKAAKPVCDALAEGCNRLNQTEEKWLACLNGYVACAVTQLEPVQLSGINVYDVRKKCNPELPLCYNFTLIDKYLNQPSVQKALGVDKRFITCNRLVDLVLAYAGDWMLDFNANVAYVLDQGYRFMVYAGEYDFICNWLGNQAWVEALDWSGKEAFKNAANVTWHVDSRPAGSARSAKGFTFVRVKDAGHMVPRDQPQNSLDMMVRHIFDKPFN